MPRPQLGNVWTISKSKRTVRPLVAKIHALNELYTSYPSIVEFDIEQFQSSTESQVYPGIINPKDPSQRLSSLKPFISSELYQTYSEIFQIFKSIIQSVEASANPPTASSTSTDPSHSTPPSKISLLCCYKIGQSMALYSRSSHYKLNNSLLFDKKERKQDAIVENEFEDDIDHWLEMEPSQIVLAHRKDLIIGYIIHLLVFHSNLLLYTLIPILVDWLFENKNYHSIARNLFQEYWYNNDEYDEGVRNRIFWTFLKTGYWNQFITKLDLKSSYYSSSSQYASLILDSLPLNNKFSNKVKLDLLLNTSELHKLIELAPQHFQVNNILIHTLGKYINCFRSDLKQSSDPSRSEQVLQAFHQFLSQFLSLWLGSSDKDTGLVFNSLLPGNEDLFTALEKITKYCMAISDKVGAYIDLTELSAKFVTVHNTTLILKWYFLLYPIDYRKRNLHFDVKRISTFIVNLQNTKLRVVRNSDFDEFIVWVKTDLENMELAKACLERYYKKENSKVRYGRIHAQLIGEKVPIVEIYSEDSDEDADMVDTSYELQ
ncbi:hypothetical protein CLIB1423_08S01684 [[Candida] railenensis]|uniref:Uncharacterized protein n=1 Tax=[Candida] railenensis TaxID=45579 RepID=A0A9P0QQ31_9ASCO|nr:hypothetical protein CLIB1423_08S01684 [[Candida] railenensis]